MEKYIFSRDSNHSSNIQTTFIQKGKDMQQPTIATVAKLFNMDIVYIVPDYQRWYVWGQDIQWEPLWSDILNLVNGTTPSDKHYMGTILTKYHSNNAGEPSKKIIVDGQQRITTLQIVLLAISKTLYSLAKNLNDNSEIDKVKKIAKDIQTYTVNSKNDYPNNEEVKILHFGDDHDEFYSIVKDINFDSEHIICQCFNYFNEMFKNWLSNSNQMVDYANKLREAVLNKIILMEIELNSDDNEYIIFEALNARGEPLTEWGKTKNHFMFKAKDAGNDNFYQQNLDKYDSDKWWTTPARIGTGKKLNNIENMLRYWLEIQKSEDIPDDKVYYTLKKYIGTQEFMEVISSFNDYSDIFKTLETYDELSDDSVQSIFMYHRTIMRTVVTIPLMMKLFQLLGKGTDFDNCTRIIESYLVRRVILHYSGRRYDTLFTSLLQKVNELSDSRLVIPTLIEELTNISEGDDNLDWPDDNIVRKTIIEYPIYDIIRGPRTKMILEAVNRYIIPEKSGNPIYPKGELHIEHIMPKKWETHWNLSDKATDEDREKRIIAVDKLGNLTLLPSKLNSAISNSGWEKKRSEIEKYNTIFLNKNLLVDASSEGKWDEEKIDSRCKYLAEIICEIWPNANRFKEEFDL